MVGISVIIDMDSTTQAVTIILRYVILYIYFRENKYSIFPRQLAALFPNIFILIDECADGLEFVETNPNGHSQSCYSM